MSGLNGCSMRAVGLTKFGAIWSIFELESNFKTNIMCIEFAIIWHQLSKKNVSIKGQNSGLKYKFSRKYFQTGFSFMLILWTLRRQRNQGLRKIFLHLAYGFNHFCLFWYAFKGFLLSSPCTFSLPLILTSYSGTKN